MSEQNPIWIWDFDNVLYYNKPFDYYNLEQRKITTQQMLKENKLEFQEGDILLTGRLINQKDEVIKMLEKEGYKFSEVIFNEKLIDLPTYFKWKKKKIIELNKKFDGNIVVIDDLKRIVDICKELKVETYQFNITELYEL